LSISFGKDVIGFLIDKSKVKIIKNVKLEEVVCLKQKIFMKNIAFKNSKLLRFA